MAFRNLGLSDALGQGIDNKRESDKNNADQKYKYLEAMMRQKKFEQDQEKQDFDTAKEVLNLISKKYPMGDREGDRQFAMFSQTEEYKEAAKHIKRSIPGAFENGNLIRLPDYAVNKDKLEFKKAELEQRVISGEADDQEVQAYGSIKSESQLYDTAVALAQDDRRWSSASPAEKTGIINRNVIDLHRQRADQGQKSPQRFGDLINAFSPSGVVGSGNQLSGFLRNQPQAPQQEAVPQGVTPVPANQQQPTNYRDKLKQFL